jgi:hypothetical protein
MNEIMVGSEWKRKRRQRKTASGTYHSPPGLPKASLINNRKRFLQRGAGNFDGSFQRAIQYHDQKK